MWSKSNKETTPVPHRSYKYNILLSIIVICVILSIITTTKYTLVPPHEHTPDTTPLKELLFKDGFSRPIPGEDHIMFIESSCAVSTRGYTSNEPLIHLLPYQACAIESAAKTNPNSTVYLFYTCPLDGHSLSRSSDLVKGVFAYPNVRLWHQSMLSFFENTPLEEFYKSDAMARSFYRTSHASDVLRFLALWKYGGTYLDLDFVIRRPLSDLGTNFAGRQNDDFVASGAMRFSSTEFGKDITSRCVEELRTNFMGSDWNHNGPGLITRVLAKICGVNQAVEMSQEKCQGFNVLPPPVFYPVVFSQYHLLHDSANSDATMRQVDASHAVHLWSSTKAWRFDARMHRGADQPYVMLQRQFCPATASHRQDVEGQFMRNSLIGLFALTYVFYVVYYIHKRIVKNVPHS